jgi:hypothetical protein
MTTNHHAFILQLSVDAYNNNSIISSLCTFYITRAPCRIGTGCERKRVLMTAVCDTNFSVHVLIVLWEEEGMKILYINIIYQHIIH